MRRVLVNSCIRVVLLLLAVPHSAMGDYCASDRATRSDPYTMGLQCSRRESGALKSASIAADILPSAIAMSLLVAPCSVPQICA